MNKPIFLAIILAIALTGCLHHKKKNENHLKSKERKVLPEIEKYHQEKKEREAIKVVEIPLPPKEEKRDPEVIYLPPAVANEPEVDKKKPETWWPWD